MNNNFIENGFNFDVIPSGCIHQSLPADSYKTAFNPTNGKAWLVRDPGRVAVSLRHSKIYGNAKEIADHAITAWQKRGKHTGILLSGVWGTGKSVTSHLIASGALIDLEVPVIFVSPEHVNPAVIDLVNSITCECVVIMDELDKSAMVGSDDDVSAGKLLELLDGVSSNNHMYILVCNETRRLPPGILNRPGRVLYHWKHEYLTEDAIREVCTDKGVPEDISTALCRLTVGLNVLTYDNLSSLIYEYQEFGTHPQDAMRYLNIKAASKDYTLCRIMQRYEGEEYYCGTYNYKLDGSEPVDVHLADAISDKLNGTWGITIAGGELLRGFNNGKYIYKDPDIGVIVELIPQESFDALTSPYIWS